MDVCTKDKVKINEQNKSIASMYTLNLKRFECSYSAYDKILPLT